MQMSWLHICKTLSSIALYCLFKTLPISEPIIDLIPGSKKYLIRHLLCVLVCFLTAILLFRDGIAILTQNVLCSVLCLLSISNEVDRNIYK